MQTIQADLESATLPSSYDYITKRPSRLGLVVKKIFELWCRFIFSAYAPVTVHGTENLPRGSFIFCSNHASHMDSAVLMAASGRGFKKFGLIAAKDYFFDHPVRKYTLNLLMNLIPIDRHDKSRESMVEYLLACREFTRNGGRNIIVYPEGTRSVTGEMASFKKGPAMISVELGLPIVPVYIDGTFSAWRKGTVFIRPRHITLNIGEPVHPEGYRGEPGGREGANFRAYKAITEEVERRVHALRDKLIDDG